MRMGVMPRHLALSGMRHATLLPPLRGATDSVCALERPNLPLLPRCASRCWKAARVCSAHFALDARDSWDTTRYLDAAAGLRPHITRGGGGGGGGGGGAGGVGGGTRVVRVLLAARHGRRLLTNVHELAAECNGTRLDPSTRLQCEVLPADSSPRTKVTALREANIFVCVWGGDTVHALHMRRGSAIIELRAAGFANAAPREWLKLHQKWVTKCAWRPLRTWLCAAPVLLSRAALGRFSGKATERPLHFSPLMLPVNASIIGRTQRDCFEANRVKLANRRSEIAKFEREAAAEVAAVGAGATTRRRPPAAKDEAWLCYWNADLRASWSDLRAALSAAAAKARLSWRPQPGAQSVMG